MKILIFNKKKIKKEKRVMLILNFIIEKVFVLYFCFFLNFKCYIKINIFYYCVERNPIYVWTFELISTKLGK